MVQLLQANCLALGPCLAPNPQREGCVHERMWMWLALFARLFLFPPKLGGGEPGEWDHLPYLYACTQTAILPQTHKHEHTPVFIDSIWWWVLEGKLESVKVKKVWTVTPTTAGYSQCVYSTTVITTCWLTCIINLLHQIHFIISLSLMDRWDEPSSKWQGN